MGKRIAAVLGSAALLATPLLAGSASAAPSGANWVCGAPWTASRAEGHASIQYCEGRRVLVALVTDDRADGRCPRLSGYLYHNGYYVNSGGVGPKGATRYVEIFAPSGDYFYTAGLSWESC
ncbi:hypothetical protein ACFWCB_09400 [Streptomyces sp. NPDC060048]|uniref:hypothetical protein n=1 Tax=unclassified Streptomyces TaxID=2593676 RepID=UPI0036D18425